MTTIRQQRVSDLLYEELSILIGNELDDPKLSLVTVSHVVISRDLRSAKVYVNHQNPDATRQEVIRGLRSATSFMRGELASRLSLRAVPELLFYYDDLAERAERIDDLLARIASTREDDGSSGSSAEGATQDAAAGPGSAVDASTGGSTDGLTDAAASERADR